MKDWHIGCSGFHYKHWKGPFYPADLPQKKWFDHYWKHFNTLELNVTFYRFPRLSFLQNWYQQSPLGFRFAVKAPRAITHYKKFKEATAFITSFYDTINNGLQEKLGPVLFQMPPGFSYTEERLDRIINSLNPLFKNVLEPRHISWWNDEVYQGLAKNNITFCGMSHPLLPDDLIQNTNVIYYRFHGVPNLYQSRYSIEFLQKMVGAVELSANTQEAWFYFNNDFDANAIFNAREMIDIVQSMSGS